MELKVFRDTLSTMASLCETKAELPIETEILIPDYLPQVFKIVKCFVYLVTLQKQITAGRLTVEGYLRCVVYYLSLIHICSDISAACGQLRREEAAKAAAT